jgi:hypothetical protein
VAVVSDGLSQPVQANTRMKLRLDKGHFFTKYEVITAVTMKNAVFWDVALCGFCKN